MTPLSTRHKEQMRGIARLNERVACIGTMIEAENISTPEREADNHAMRQVEAGTFERRQVARHGMEG